MKVGDIIEHNMGHIGIVTDVRMMYPRSPMSPVDAVKVTWQHTEPDWTNTALWFSMFAINRVVSSAK